MKYFKRSIFLYPKRQSFLSFIRSYIKGCEGVEPEEKKRNAPMAMKRLFNIHEVRNHSGARLQNQEVVKTLFLISSRHTPFFTVLFFSAFSVLLYLFSWITLCLCQGISVWMCAGSRSTRWETWTDLSSLGTHFHLHSRGRTPFCKLPQQLVSCTHTHAFNSQIVLMKLCSFVNHKPFFVRISTLVSKVSVHIFDDQMIWSIK